MCVKEISKNVASLRHGTAEGIELVVHGDSTTSNVVGRQIGDIKLPVGAMIAAILRKMRLSLHVVRWPLKKVIVSLFISMIRNLCQK